MKARASIPTSVVKRSCRKTIRSGRTAAEEAPVRKTMSIRKGC
jgi:hypothetical protein